MHSEAEWTWEGRPWEWEWDEVLFWCTEERRGDELEGRKALLLLEGEEAGPAEGGAARGEGQVDEWQRGEDHFPQGNLSPLRVT